MATPVMEGWITVQEAATLTGYTPAHIRYLTRKGKVEAQKTGRDWMILRSSLLAYRARMNTLGPQKHNPWREDLATEGRGRRPDETE